MLRIFRDLTMVSRFSYREAIEEGCFLQLPLFGVDGLTRAVAARGLADHPIGLSWEPLDSEGLLPPVAYSRIESLASALHLTALEEESLILRDEHGYLEWEDNGLTPLYAHWQLLSAARLDEALRGRSPLVMLAGGTQQLSKHLAGRAEALRDPEYPGRIAAGQREIELLLTRTQSLFMPLIRDSYRREAIFDRRGEPTGQDTEQWTMEQISQLDYAQAAEQCGVTADDLQQHHDSLQMEIDRGDPLKEWRDLTDRVDRRKIEALTGEVRRIQDLRDAAGVLRRWHRSLVGAGNLLDEWDAGRHYGPSRREVNKARYGCRAAAGSPPLG